MATTIPIPLGRGAAGGGEHPRPRGFGRPARLAVPLGSLPGVGSTLVRRLAPLGLANVGDLLLRRPRRYEPAASEVAIADLMAGEEVAIAGVVTNARLRRPRRRRLTILTCRVADPTGSVAATWFNQPWLAERLVPGTRVRLRGRLGRQGFEVRSFDTGEARATADYAPVYSASAQVSSPRIRELVRSALADHAADVLDPLPAELEFPIRRDAVAAVHFPADPGEAELARRRLAFDELLALQLAVARSRVEQPAGTPLPPPGPLAARYRSLLPFALTPHQEAALAAIDTDLAREIPMRRLLQGDVGSGKTVVALYALVRAVEAGRQGALMVPTETLAEQHFLTIEGLCAGLGIAPVLLTGGGARRARAAIENGSAQIVVGTHALIQRDVSFADLAVAVVDEQHRFGVEQREALAELRPHVLHMTATPIPRTLALTMFGDLAVTEIAGPPASRKPIITAWVGAERSSEAYARLRVHLDAGRQAYVVCPLIEASETLLARAAAAEAERLRGGELAGYRVGLLHGRLRAGERREVMAAFAAGELDVLVATTVIEVGVDVPNATIMIVQEADRFGLAQLHQLRGRVGRGPEQSYCLLVSRPKLELTEAATARLETLVATGDGFELAERDLDLRREGQLLGLRQSGLGNLRFAHLRRDRDLLEQARALAEELVEREGPWHDTAEAVLSGADPALLA